MTEFNAIDCGDMSDIPPEMGAGKFEATCAVKKSATKKDKFPMLVLEWGITGVADGNEENECYVGSGKATDFVTFFPANHKASRMSRLRLKQMCEALKVEVPNTQRIGSWDDLQGLIDSLNGMTAEIYTTIEVRKDNGENAVKVSYTPPVKKLDLAGPAADDDDDKPKKKSKK